MARFKGEMYWGAMRDVRRLKRAEAEERNRKTRPERRRSARRQK